MSEGSPVQVGISMRLLGWRIPLLTVSDAATGIVINEHDLTQGTA